DLDSQVMQLERAISVLRAQRAHIEDRLDSYRYPVLTLPNEIVSEIFVHFLPVYPERPPVPGILSPTNLTQICRKWRQVALATPALWRAITLSIYPTGTFERQLQECQAWLRRSGSCPLSLAFEFFDAPALRHEIFKSSSPHSDRWEVVKITVCTFPIPLISIPMPRLRRLEISMDGLNTPSDPGHIPIGAAPLLRSVVLNNRALKGIIIPWAQLTSLRLDCVSPNECVPVLKQTLNLVDCHL
ncbi:hypothetical protein C8R46DRAFT_860439, partial [Mycena filopes]